MRDFLKIVVQILLGSIRMIFSFFVILLVVIFLGYIAQHVPIQTFLGIIPEIELSD